MSIVITVLTAIWVVTLWRMKEMNARIGDKVTVGRPLGLPDVRTGKVGKVTSIHDGGGVEYLHVVGEEGEDYGFLTHVEVSPHMEGERALAATGGGHW